MNWSHVFESTWLKFHTQTHIFTEIAGKSNLALADAMQHFQFLISHSKNIFNKILLQT